MNNDFSRRRVLRGMLSGGAVTLALPFLDCMLNTNGTALAGGRPLPVRFGTWNWGLGMNSQRWVPTKIGADYDLLAGSTHGIDLVRRSARGYLLEGRLTHQQALSVVILPTSPACLARAQPGKEHERDGSACLRLARLAKHFHDRQHFVRGCCVCRGCGRRFHRQPGIHKRIRSHEPTRRTLIGLWSSQF